MTSITNNDLGKRIRLSNVSSNLIVVGFQLPDLSRRAQILALSRPIDSPQKVLCDRRREDDIVLSVVDEDLVVVQKGDQLVSHALHPIEGQIGLNSGVVVVVGQSTGVNRGPRRVLLKKDLIRIRRINGGEKVKVIRLSRDVFVERVVGIKIFVQICVKYIECLFPL